MDKKMFAIIRTGGKQYKVAEQQVVKIEKTDGEVGSNIKFDVVLAIANEKGVEIGSPTIQGATVSAEILEQKKDDKVIIFKKKRRQNYRRKNGHRQQVTVVRILDVSGKGEIKKIAPKAIESKKTEETAKTSVDIKDDVAPKKAKSAAKNDTDAPKKIKASATKDAGAAKKPTNKKTTNKD